MVGAGRRAATKPAPPTAKRRLRLSPRQNSEIVCRTQRRPAGDV